MEVYGSPDGYLRRWRGYVIPLRKMPSNLLLDYLFLVTARLPFSWGIMQSNGCHRVIDIGVNLTNRAFRTHWREVVQRSIQASADIIILTGTSLKSSRECMDMAQTWFNENGTKNLYFTVGVHPHDAKTFDEQTTLQSMKCMLEHPLV